MKPKTMKTILILLEMKDVIRDLLRKKYKGPALLNIYAFIDICASLNVESRISNRKTFESYLEKYINPWNKAYTIYDLWAARSSLLHSLSPLGDHTEKPNGATPIFYYSKPEIKERVEPIIKSRGYAKFHLLDVDEIFYLAIDSFNNFHHNIEMDPESEEKVIHNAENILEDMDFYRLEEELTLIEDYKKMIEVE